jgi:hypothetical protein
MEVPASPAELPELKEFFGSSHVRCWRVSSDGLRQVGWLLGERATRGQPEEQKHAWSNLPAAATSRQDRKASDEHPGVDTHIPDPSTAAPATLHGDGRRNRVGGMDDDIARSGTRA